MSLGSYTIWLYMRIGQILFSLVAVAIVVEDLLLCAPAILNDALFLLLLISTWFYAHPIAYGLADEKGILYRRYFRKRYVPWKDIDDVQCKGVSRLVVQLKTPSWLGKELQFPLNPSIKQAALQLFRKREPAVLYWVREKIVESRGRS